MIHRVILTLAVLAILANVGVCVWAIANDKPHQFAGSGCIAILLWFQAANIHFQMKRSKP